MNAKTRFWLLSIALVAVLALTGCGGGGGGGGGEGGGDGSLTLGVQGESLAYDQTTLTAPANTEVTVTFNNTSTSQQHNWVLANGGDEVAAEIDEAAVSNPPEYLPSDMSNVIAHTQMLQPGGSDSVTFTTPGPGTYTYLCTFPGHYAAGMKGTLTVE